MLVEAGVTGEVQEIVEDLAGRKDQTKSGNLQMVLNEVSIKK